MQVPKRLTDPSAGKARRNALERSLAPRYRAEGETFVTGVRMDALGALSAPVLLAAAPAYGPFGLGDPSLTRGPFVLGGTMDRWHILTEALQGMVVASLGTTAMSSAAMQPFIERLMTRLRANPLPASVHEAVQRVLMHSVNERWTRLQIQESLKTLLVEGGETVGASVRWQQQIDEIARTQATAAHNFRTITELPESGFGSKRWVARNDGRTRETHQAADSQVVPLNEPFIVGGYSLDAPGDPFGPPEETYNCRCIVVGAYDESGSEWTPEWEPAIPSGV